MKYLAFDIETTKQPNKFPEAHIDNVMMISLMYEVNNKTQYKFKREKKTKLK